MNPFLKRVAKAGETGKGRASEKRVAKKVGARLTPNSGAGSHKGDMVYGQWLVEAKATSNMSMKLDLAWLVKIANEALNTKKTPAVAISFVHNDGTPRHSGDWVMIPLSKYRELAPADTFED